MEDHKRMDHQGLSVHPTSAQTWSGRHGGDKTVSGAWLQAAEANNPTEEKFFRP
jgi:hypothetical protein